MPSKVKGLDRLKRQLRLLPNSVRSAMADALRDGAEEMANGVRLAAPRGKTGNLKKSVGFSEGPPPKTRATGAFRINFSQVEAGLMASALHEAGLQYTVYAGDDDAFYARWVEFGTAPSVRGARVGARVSDRKQSKLGRIAQRTHPGSRSQPFFFPTIRAKKKVLRNRVVRATNKAAKAVAALR